MCSWKGQWLVVGESIGCSDKFDLSCRVSAKTLGFSEKLVMLSGRDNCRCTTLKYSLGLRVSRP